MNTKWKQYGTTVAGGKGKGNRVNQLSSPYGIYVDDDDQCIYIADYGNARIVQWKYNAEIGEIVAGGNGEGNKIDQLSQPTDVIVDRKSDSLIICDLGNRRVIKWTYKNNKSQQIIISDIDCYGLAMDHDGDLYVSDSVKNEVKRYKTGETNGTVVAGGNGKGDKFNQLNEPSYLFVDQEHSVYVSDYGNQRVVKWLKGAKSGIVVAGGEGKGNKLTQLSDCRGLVVNHWGYIFVADMGNHRIMLWTKESKNSRIIVGGNGFGEQRNQFKYLRALSIDRQGNLYVVDCGNNRIQKFEIKYE